MSSSTAPRRLVAGIETGGTKIVCGVAAADNPQQVLERITVPTEAPEVSLGKVREFLDEQHRQTPIEAAAVAAFGPVDADPASPRYGTVLNTPKLAWRGANVFDALAGIPDATRTLMVDVDGSLWGERLAGAGKSIPNLAYLTVGTGVGGSLMAGGELVRGHRLPELGHVLPRRHPEDNFDGVCPTHGDCIEGLAAGPAMRRREQTQSEEDLTRFGAYYIAHLCSMLALTGIPDRIIIGGGVSSREGLLDAAQIEVDQMLGDYLTPASYTGKYSSDGVAAVPAIVPQLVAPGLGGDAGLMGTLLRAAHLLD